MQTAVLALTFALIVALSGVGRDDMTQTPYSIQHTHLLTVNQRILLFEVAPLLLYYRGGTPDLSVQARWDDLGPSVIEGGYKIGVASDFWNRYEEDILLAKGLGARRSWDTAAPLSCRPCHQCPVAPRGSATCCV